MSDDEVKIYLPVIRKTHQDCKLTLEQLEVICKAYDVVEIKKDKYYCNHGQICETSAIIVSGTFISQYYKNDHELKNTKDECLYIVNDIYYNTFCPFLNHGNSFYKSSYCLVSLKACNNALILTITLKALDNLCNQFPELKFLRATIAEANHKISSDRIFKLNVFKNDDKGLVNDFDATHPGQAKIIGYGNTGSYLNMNRNKPGAIILVFQNIILYI